MIPINANQTPATMANGVKRVGQGSDTNIQNMAMPQGAEMISRMISIIVIGRSSFIMSKYILYGIIFFPDCMVRNLTFLTHTSLLYHAISVMSIPLCLFLDATPVKMAGFWG